MPAKTGAMKKRGQSRMGANNQEKKISKKHLTRSQK
jgi:hypothetical protein